MENQVPLETANNSTTSPQAFPLGYVKALMEVVLPQLLTLAAKDERFRKLVLAGMSRDLRELEARHGVDKNVVDFLAGLFDQMIVDGIDREIPFGKMNPSNARQKLFRAAAYLVDFQDPQGKYAELRDQIEMQELKNEDRQLCGMRIAFVRKKGDPVFEARQIARETKVLHKQIDWRNSLAMFLGQADVGGTVELTDLNLSAEDQKVVEELFEGQPEYNIMRLSKSEIIVVRVA